MVAELPDSTVVTVHADYGVQGGKKSPVTSDDRVVSSQTPSAHYSDVDIESLIAAAGSAADSPALTEPAAGAADSVAAAGTNTTASTSASASSLVQMSSPTYNSLLRDSDNSRDTAGNPHSNNEHVALYARTERLGGTSPAGRSSSLVDVHA